MSFQESIREIQLAANARFGNLQFKEASHEYFVGGEKLKASVSGQIHKFIDHPDWDAIAERIARREKTTKQAILDQWAAKNKLACDNGSQVHDFAENYSASSVPRMSKEVAASKFLDWLGSQHRYKIVFKELPMYHFVHRFPGTTDLVLYDTEVDRFIIADYKTNEDLFKNFAQNTLLEPFDFLLDCPYNHYQIQLSYYQILLQQLNVKVSERWLVYLEENCDYKIYKCHDFTSYIYPTLAA